MGFLAKLLRLLKGPPDGEAPRQTQARRGLHQDSPQQYPGHFEVSDGARLGSLGLPLLHTTDELAAAMGIERSEINWLADPRRGVARRGGHYRPILRRKRDGRTRVLLAPLDRLKSAQRWILRNILDLLPVSEHCHGFVKQRSIQTNARPHVGQGILVHLDLRDFFHQFTMRHVRGLFRSIGYSTDVAWTLAYLTTAPVRTSAVKLAQRSGMQLEEFLDAVKPDRRWRGVRPFLPQGAPTSPAIANLLCRRLDARLAGLAQKFDATYTRYADDLTFSGGAELRRALGRFLPLVRLILREHKLPMNHAKLRFARRGSRQQVTGLIVNSKLNVASSEIRCLRAILHNASKSSLEAQNRHRHEDFRPHLQGRIAFVAAVNPERGARLKGALAAVS